MDTNDSSLLDGCVVQITPSGNGRRYHGIIRSEGAALLKRGRFFFHCNDIVDGAELREGDRVRFLPTNSNRPRQLPRAVNVSRVN
jgi:hypothetical protein